MAQCAQLGGWLEPRSALRSGGGEAGRGSVFARPMERGEVVMGPGRGCRGGWNSRGSGRKQPLGQMPQVGRFQPLVPRVSGCL